MESLLHCAAIISQTTIKQRRAKQALLTFRLLHDVNLLRTQSIWYLKENSTTGSLKKEIKKDFSAIQDPALYPGVHVTLLVCQDWSTQHAHSAFHLNAGGNTGSTQNCPISKSSAVMKRLCC